MEIDGLNISMSTTNKTLGVAVAAAINGTHAVPMKAERKRAVTKLEKLEAGLQRARVAIKEASIGNQTQDPDFVPLGPMYWDSKAFHRYICVTVTLCSGKLYMNAVKIVL